MVLHADEAWKTKSKIKIRRSSADAGLLPFRSRRSAIMSNWVIEMKKADFNLIGARFGISPITARLLRNRGLTDFEEIEDYLHGGAASLHNPYLMKGMDTAVSLLRSKIADKRKIRIIGDYDIDGVNAAYILLCGLLKCGADADTDIPDRMKDGYGINESMITEAYSDGVDTIITCDNGIAAGAAVSYARCLGMTVIVTDHHQVPFEDTENGREYMLPDADVVIDPHQEGCRYPYKDLCGAAIAYKLIAALWQVSGVEEDADESFMENVAVATIGDIVSLTGENRILAKMGLEHLEHTENTGMKSLISLCGLAGRKLNAYDIGFVIGPCINAGGRLDTAKRALNLLLSTDRKEAEILAGDLAALNRSRKDMTERGVEEAIQMIDSSSLKEDRVIVLYLPSCHESLAGIIAGRLRDRYYRPVLVLTNGEQGIKGSGRSIEAYSMFEELSRCASLLIKFGGHPMAAGLSLEEKNIAALRSELNRLCTLKDSDLEEKVKIDMALPFSYVTEQLIGEISLLEPFGKDNEKPIFGQLGTEIMKLSVLGQKRNVIRMMLKDACGSIMTGICFGDSRRLLSFLAGKYGDDAVQRLLNGNGSGIFIDLTYYPDINEYRGMRSMQAVVRNYR